MSENTRIDTKPAGASPLGDLPGWLFCPADRPERFEKAAAAADVVILDLEDAVGPGDKASARQSLIQVPLDPARTVVRINALDTADREKDLAALRKTGYTTLMVPKCESPADVESVSEYQVVALIETPLGVVKAADIVAGGNVVGAMWGAEDLTAKLGGQGSRKLGGGYRDVALHARSSVLLAASAYERFVLDAVFLDIADTDGLAEEAKDAVASGFSGTACIHPSQVAIVRAAYRPSDQQTAWASRVLAAAQGERGVFRFEGKMVDAPVLAHAEKLLSRGR